VLYSKSAHAEEEAVMSNWKWAKGRSVQAAIQAAIFLLLGLGAVWFAKAVAGVTSSAILSVLAIIPALLYVILRGDLAELRGPGGWAATFRVTNATVTFAFQKFDLVAAAQRIQKGSLSDLDRLVGRLNRNDPVLLTMTMHKHYDAEDMEQYLKVLSDWPRFKLVAIMDESGRFVGCASASGFHGLIRNGRLAHEFLRFVEEGNQDEVFRYPGILEKVISAETTNAGALAAMDELGLDALAVVGEDRHVKGIVERERLVSKLILSLAEDAARNRQ
jgi:CBS domain-containing protein